jgi:hypothetical protein
MGQRKEGQSLTFLVFLGVSLLRSFLPKTETQNKDKNQKKMMTKEIKLYISQIDTSIRRNFPVARNIRETRRGVDFQSDRKRRDDQLRPFRMPWLFYVKQPRKKKFNTLRLFLIDRLN